MGYLDSLPPCCIALSLCASCSKSPSFILDLSPSSPSLVVLLRIRSLLTYCLPIGLLRDPRGCFSNLFTATDHSTIRGSRLLHRLLSHCSRLFFLSPQLCQTTFKAVLRIKTTTSSTCIQNVTTTFVDGVGFQEEDVLEGDEQGGDLALI